MDVFTSRQAALRGITRTQLAGPGFQQLYHGVHMPTGTTAGLHEWVRGAALVLPAHCRPGGRTAFQLAGVDTGPVLPVVFASPEPVRVRRTGILMVVRREWPGGLWQAWEEVVRTESLLAAVTVGDRALHRGCVDAGFFAGAPAGSAAGLVRPGSESWRETWLRLCLVLAGLPEPALQQWIVDGGGRRIARVDGLYREQRVVVEYDGEHHRTDDRQYAIDITRTGNLTDEGYLVVRVAKAHAADPWAVVSRVAVALRSRGLDVRPQRSALWVQTFCR